MKFVLKSLLKEGQKYLKVDAKKEMEVVTYVGNQQYVIGKKHFTYLDIKPLDKFYTPE